MSKVLVIGAGGVSSVCVHKMAQLSGENAAIFPEIHLASRTLAKCDAIATSVKARTGVVVPTYEIDAEEVPAMVNLITRLGATHVINLALPYQDLPIMDACLEAGAHYLDTANYEPKDE
ncbi:MAG: saccharopine dehydrogenase NADP-binding domain-containing protein, partial [Erythrobacter sp.]